MSTVIPFSRPASGRHGNWSQQELAEFYRVEAALLRAGFSIASEHGLSDEGEPWFVFCRPDGDAIIHFARIDGSYLVASDALDRPVRGPDFRTLIDQIARLHPDLLPIPAAGRGTTLVVHPAALLAALVAAAALSLSSEDAHAGPLEAGPDDTTGTAVSREAGSAPGHAQPAKATGSGGPGDRETDRKQFEALILSAMIFAAEAMAADHGATGAELNLDVADQAGTASSHTAPSDAAASSTGLGSGRGSGAAAQPAVLTAQGSGADTGSPSQPTSDTGGAGNRVDGVPAARIAVPGDMPKPPSSQKQHPAQGAGSDVAPAATSADPSTTKTSGQQASAGGRAEAGAAASDGSAPEPSGGRTDSVSVSIAEPVSQARSAPDAASGPLDSGIAAAKSAWIKAAGETGPDREPKAAVSHEADDRGHGREAKTETPAGTNPHGDGEGPGGSHAGGVGRGRGSPAETAPGNGPKADRDADGDGRAGKMAKDQGAHEEAAAGADPQAAQTHPGRGHAHGAGRDGGAPAEATAGNASDAEPTFSGKGHAKVPAQDRGAPARAAADDASPDQHAGDGGTSDTVAENRGSKAEAAAGSDPQVAQADHGDSHARGAGQGRGSRAEAVTGDSPGAERADAEQTGRAHGKETAGDRGSRGPAEADSGDGSQPGPVNGGDGHRSGDGSQARPAPRGETGPDTPAAAHGGTSNSRLDRGSAAQTDADTAGHDRGADRVDGRGSAPAGRSDHRGPDAQGPDAVDPTSGQGRPASSSEPRSEAAPEAKARVPVDPDPVDHGHGASGERGTADERASRHDAAADRASAPEGPAQEARSPSPEPARGGPSGHGSHGSGPDSAASGPSDDGMSGGGTGHERKPSDVAAETASNAHTERAEDPAPHGPLSSEQAAIRGAADRDSPATTTGGDPARTEHGSGHGTRAAGDGQDASPAGEHGGADSTPPDGGPAPAANAPAHGADADGPSVTSRGSDQTAASPSGTGARAENAPIDPKQGKVEDEARLGEHADAAPAHPPAGQSGSAASDGARDHAATAPGRPSHPPAAIDATGNLVFHADAHQDPVRPAPPHGPEDAAAHHTVGLVGISDQAHPVHDLYHQG